MTTRQAIDGLISAWMAGDALRASAFFSTDARYVEAGRDPVQGRDAIAAYFTRFFRDGPPWRFELDEAIVEGQRAAIAYRFHIRDAAGAWHERPGCAIVTFESSLVTLWREYQG